MYIALGVLLLGILFGRLCAKWLSETWLNRLMTIAIFILLFLLGAQIGSDNELLERLPEIGLVAFILAIAAIGGSILCVLLTKSILKKSGHS